MAETNEITLSQLKHPRTETGPTDFDLVRNFEDVKGHAKVVTLAEIEANDWNLNIARYVEPIIEEETIAVAEALNNLQMALTEAYAAEDYLRQLLAGAGLVPTGEME